MKTLQVRYKHTNIIARDWKRLANFYEKVFNCKRLLPERHLQGSWLDKVTALEKVSLDGVHLLLPGYGEKDPTLEIFSYNKIEDKPLPKTNRSGIAHIAFEVDNVQNYYSKVIENGGKKIGDITTQTVEGVGKLTVVYMLDPEDNIIELQSWS